MGSTLHTLADSSKLLNIFVEVPQWVVYGLVAGIAINLVLAFAWTLAKITTVRPVVEPSNGPVKPSRYGLSHRNLADARFEEMRDIPW